MFDPRLIVLQPTAFCNIDCTYCYLTNRNDRRLMSPAVLDAVCSKIISRLDPNSTATLVWHAGEPTAAPIGWYEDAYRRLSCSPPSITFAMQSNGIAIDERWIDLFCRTGTQVSISLDGPQPFHDLRRLTRNGKPTWHLALRGLKRLQQAGRSPSVITVLHPQGLNSGREYYEFYRDNEITDVSFSIDELEGHHTKSSFELSRLQTAHDIVHCRNNARSIPRRVPSSHSGDRAHSAHSGRQYLPGQRTGRTMGIHCGGS